MRRPMLSVALCGLAWYATPAAAGWFWSYQGDIDPVMQLTAEGRIGWHYDGKTGGVPPAGWMIEPVAGEPGNSASRLIDQNNIDSVRWYAYCRQYSAHLPPPGEQYGYGIEEYRPDATGHTASFRFKVNSFGIDPADPTKSKIITGMDCGLADHVHNVSHDLRIGCPTGDPAGGVYLYQGKTTYRYDGMGTLVSTGAHYYLDGPRLDDGNWHSVYLWAVPHDDPAQPSFCHYRMYVDGVLLDEYYRGGDWKAAWKWGWDGEKQMIDMSWDYFMYSYQAIEIPEPAGLLAATLAAAALCLCRRPA